MLRLHIARTNREHATAQCRRAKTIAGQAAMQKVMGRITSQMRPFATALTTTAMEQQIACIRTRHVEDADIRNKPAIKEYGKESPFAKTKANAMQTPTKQSNADMAEQEQENAAAHAHGQDGAAA